MTKQVPIEEAREGDVIVVNDRRFVIKAVDGRSVKFVNANGHKDIWHHASLATLGITHVERETKMVKKTNMTIEEVFAAAKRGVTEFWHTKAAEEELDEFLHGKNEPPKSKPETDPLPLRLVGGYGDVCRLVQYGKYGGRVCGIEMYPSSGRDYSWSKQMDWQNIIDLFPAHEKEILALMEKVGGVLKEKQPEKK